MKRRIVFVFAFVALVLVFLPGFNAHVANGPVVLFQALDTGMVDAGGAGSTARDGGGGKPVSDPVSTGNTRLRPQDEEGNFVLYVSNQSYALSEVDIEVSVDGETFVKNDFQVGDQHVWVKHRFRLPPGKHRIRAVSSKGQAVFEEGISTGEKNWVVVSFFFARKPGKKPLGPEFRLSVSDRPVGFL